MKYTHIIIALSTAAVLTGSAQGITESDRLSCTSIMVGKKASADGSVITSHTCDSWYRTWMQWVPAADYKNDTVMTIYDGLMHTENPQSMQNVKVKGTIPQVKHTYRFLNTAYPCLNEKQLAMGETTISGRDTLRNKNGMFMIEELQRVALQRCTKARDAIRLMGNLIKEYGYADGGECLTIADTEEVWIFEVFGEGPPKIGGVWAAVRIPDDEIAVSANVTRIGRLDTLDKDNYMASENVESVAKKLKLWDGKEPFCFWKAYSGGNYTGEKKNFSVREWYIMDQLAPSKHFSEDAEELPLSVKPDKKVSLKDLARLFGSYYEGTDKDYTQRLCVPNTKKEKVGDSIPAKIVSPIANPWMKKDEQALYAALGDSTFKKWMRYIAVPQCAYSTIIQLRSGLPNEIGGVAWIALDNPGESPRFPVFCGSTQLPKLLETCGNHAYREDAALWHFRQTNKLATIRWGTCRKTLEPARDYFLKKGLRELPYVESTYKDVLSREGAKEAANYLNGYTADFIGAEILKWDELYRTYWRQFWSGF